MFCASAIAAAVCPGAAGVEILGVIDLPGIGRTGAQRVGGLSGLDYDAMADRWLAVSDDREGVSNGCWLSIEYDAEGVKGAAVTDRLVLEIPSGRAADLESLRFDPVGNRIWYASEGDIAAGHPPFVASVERDGSAPIEFPLAAAYRGGRSEAAGFRANLAVESLAFSPGGEALWTALEAPLCQDGPTAAVDSGALIRLTEHKRSGEVVRQLAYAVAPIPAIVQGGRRAANGVSEILVWDHHRLLVLERAGAEFGVGEWRFAVRLFVADVRDGEALDGRPLAARTVRPVRKEILFDFNASDHRVDNLEGIARGRRLADGRETLVLLSDDNFSPHQTTQVWVLALGSIAPTANQSHL